LVRIGRNSPRYSAGAFGFMSYISMWGGPPGSQTKITAGSSSDWTRPLPVARANSPKPSPQREYAPSSRNERREGPPQRRPLPKSDMVEHCGQSHIALHSKKAVAIVGPSRGCNPLISKGPGLFTPNGVPLRPGKQEIGIDAFCNRLRELDPQPKILTVYIWHESKTAARGTAGLIEKLQRAGMDSFAFMPIDPDPARRHSRVLLAQSAFRPSAHCFTGASRTSRASRRCECRGRCPRCWRCR
jgi:hypothetical protein